MYRTVNRQKKMFEKSFVNSSAEGNCGNRILMPTLFGGCFSKRESQFRSKKNTLQTPPCFFPSVISGLNVIYVNNYR